MIDQRLVELALEKVGTADFERFGQTLYGALQDREFVPLGGMHDGGAEGFLSAGDGSELFVDGSESVFLQVSKQQTSRAKIRDTVRRLRKYGRKPAVLTYLTSRIVPDIDKEEKLLSDELKCKIHIRDAKFIEISINVNMAIQGAFKSFLEPAISYLFQPGVSEIGSQAQEYTDRTLAVFLRQEVEVRRDNSSLLESVADSLILWSLSETDPDKGLFLNRGQILTKIEETLPAARHFIRGVLDHRLALLHAKAAGESRQIRHYKNNDMYCLPYETRRLVAVENADDDLLKLLVSCGFEDRITISFGETLDHLRSNIITCCHETLERVFERQGLEVAKFATNGIADDELYSDVATILSDFVDTLKNTPEEKSCIRKACLAIFRGTFYKSTEAERQYLSKLSRTYVLLLLLKNEPKIVEYFQSISKTFKLYIGTDILIRALSEHYLSEENKTTTNLLAILASSGAELILTQKVVEEVATHLRAQMIEFEINYSFIESKMNVDLIEYIDRILIRTYFYAKLTPADEIKGPESWRAFMDQFANYGAIRTNNGDPQLAAYMLRKFGMVYESTEEMLKEVDLEELEELTKTISVARSQGRHAPSDDDILAYNDALHILRVFQRRRETNEESPGNPFGFQTWWLTQDGKVRRAGGSASAKRGGAMFMMRPEFLLNYISLAPNLREVRDSFKKIFPTTLGVRLSSRLPRAVFDDLLHKASEVAKYDDARAGAMITDLTNKLKGDARKDYDNRWTDAV